MGPIIGTRGAGVRAGGRPRAPRRRDAPTLTGVDSSFSRPLTRIAGSTSDAAAPAVIRLNRGRRYCSGFLTAPEILTAAITADPYTGEQHLSTAEFAFIAAHFLRACEHPSEIRVSGTGFRGAVADARVVVGTDIGIVRLARPAPLVRLPPIASAVSPVLSRTVTYGFGGTTKRSVPPRHGRILAKVPFAVSLNLRTRVRHAAICVPTERDQVVYGDSGGPVLVAGEVTGLQSLLFGYRHRELLNIATVALLPPHLTALSRAMDIMSVR
nr:serine protease [Corynebacterium meridianum]